MGSLINIGFGNFVNISMVLSVVRADSAPAKRMVQTAKDCGKAVDATQGRKTKSVIVMRDDVLVLSALTPETIASRFNGRGSAVEKQMEDMQ